MKPTVPKDKLLPFADSPVSVEFLSLVERVIDDPDFLKAVSAYAATRIDEEGFLELVIDLKSWFSLSIAERRKLLRHEGSHVLLGHLSHELLTMNLDFECWVLATDSVLHHLGMCHPESDPSIVTFAKLGLPPANEVTTYLRLLSMKRKGHRFGLTPCRGKALVDSGEVLNEKTFKKLQKTLRTLEEQGALPKTPGASLGGSGGLSRGWGVKELPPVPPWVMKLQAVMSKSQRREKKRSWRRPHKQFDVLPGRAKKKWSGVRLLIDVSGSMFDRVPSLLSAVRHLSDRCEVVWWATEASPPIPAEKALEVRPAIGEGTNPLSAEQHRLSGPDEITVWVTDGLVPRWPAPPTGNEVWVTPRGSRPPYGSHVELDKP